MGFTSFMKKYFKKLSIPKNYEKTFQKRTCNDKRKKKEIFKWLINFIYVIISMT